MDAKIVVPTAPSDPEPTEERSALPAEDAELQALVETPARAAQRTPPAASLVTVVGRAGPPGSGSL